MKESVQRVCMLLPVALWAVSKLPFGFFEHCQQGVTGGAALETVIHGRWSSRSMEIGKRNKEKPLGDTYPGASLFVSMAKLRWRLQHVYDKIPK